MLKKVLEKLKIILKNIDFKEVFWILIYILIIVIIFRVFI